MAKGKNSFDEDYFLKKGFIPDGNGGFLPPKFRNSLIAESNKKSIGSDKYDFKLTNHKTPNELIINEDIYLNKPEESVIVINGLIPGLNGNKGLMRSHWSNIKKQKKYFKFIILDALKRNSAKIHEGKVTIQYIGYKSVLMDWDNFSSSFKHIGDSLVEVKIILDDKPSIVTQFIPQQIKCKRIEQKVVIIIKDYV